MKVDFNNKFILVEVAMDKRNQDRLIKNKMKLKDIQYW